MRKRTQLVGFEFGHWKHTQYIAEFLDNALDAIETFQWNELDKKEGKLKFSLDQELSLENLSIIQEIKEDESRNHLDNAAKFTLMQEVGIHPTDSSDTETELTEVKEEESGEIVDKSELEVEEEVKRILDDMNEIIQPITNIVDEEPIVIIRLREFEAPSFLTSELTQKNVMSYIFEIFDNGLGMGKGDLRKFGKYLASSKSLELKQTRGSQGFGAPSAFSDAQNTTGRPIVGVSKTSDVVYATVSEFFTTSKNEKKYLVHPTEVDSPFIHGTYIKLNYLNVKYKRGYVDTYIRETALMNPHVTIIYIDPYGEESIYRRLVSSFPKKPKYAKPHPSSTNIGDLQDLLSKSDNHTISAFLQENFVRISSKTAREILNLAERDLQEKLKLLILRNGFITLPGAKNEKPSFLQFEKRVFGRSTKPRDKLIIYEFNNDDMTNTFWEITNKYHQLSKEREKVNRLIKKLNRRIENVETKKEIKAIEKDISKHITEINSITKNKEKLKTEFDSLFNKNKDNLIEVKKLKNRSDFEDLVKEVQITKTRPNDLTNEQFNSLFHAFKSIKYMAPPTDTAIPVGDTVLESTLIKDIGLQISNYLEDFDEPEETVIQIEEDLKKTDIKEINNEKILNINEQILQGMMVQDPNYDSSQFEKDVEKVLTPSESEGKGSYEDVFNYFIDNYTKNDDFIYAETRPPTSGKGLAYVVEAALAYCNDPKKLDTPKRSRDVLSRFVNRTPKLRDSADCAITKAVQSVNWKNYKLDVYDNNLPKGPIKLLVNVSGPYVHLMFKSQSKSALADDEDLIKEIKYCLEAIGRRMRVYLNRKATIHKREKRASLIEKYIPTFVKSLHNVTNKGEGRYKNKTSIEELEKLMKQAIGVKAPQVKPAIKDEKIALEKETLQKIKIQWEEKPPQEIKPEEEKPTKRIEFSEKTLNNWTVNELKEYCDEHNIFIRKSDRKPDIIGKIIKFYSQEIIIEPPKIKPKPTEVEPVVSASITEEKPKPSEKISVPKVTEPETTAITPTRIMEVLTDDWQNITHLIFKLKIKDMMDARYLSIKMKELEREGKVLSEVRMGKKYWKVI